MHVLLVEDDPLFAEALSVLLSDIGYPTSIAATSDEAIRRIEEDETCRLIISDWMMPGMDGLDLCRLLRDRDDLGYCYFMLCTGKRSIEHRLEAIDAGVDDFLVKPVDREELLSRLHVADRILQYMRRIRGLESLLPVCCYCKKVQGTDGFWKDAEDYLKEGRGTRLTHGICPVCMKSHT